MTDETVDAKPQDGSGIDSAIDLTPTPEQSRDEQVMAAVRLIVAIATVVNIVAQPFGWQPLGIDSEQLYMVLSGIASIAATLWAWWKNNNCTKAAQAGQTFIDMVKDGRL